MLAGDSALSNGAAKHTCTVLVRRIRLYMHAPLPAVFSLFPRAGDGTMLTPSSTGIQIGARGTESGFEWTKLGSFLRNATVTNKALIATVQIWYIIRPGLLHFDEDRVDKCTNNAPHREEINTYHEMR